MSDVRRQHITLSIIADNPDELSIMTVVVQRNWAMILEFFDFAELKNGKYICWYKVPIASWQDGRLIDG